MPPPPDPETMAAFNRTVNACDKLFEALEDLGQAGGLRKLRRRISPKSVDRAAELLRSVRLAIDEQLAPLEKPEPLGPALLRRRANKPAPLAR